MSNCSKAWYATRMLYSSSNLQHRTTSENHSHNKKTAAGQNQHWRSHSQQAATKYLLSCCGFRCLLIMVDQSICLVGCMVCYIYCSASCSRIFNSNGDFIIDDLQSLTAFKLVAIARVVILQNLLEPQFLGSNL